MRIEILDVPEIGLFEVTWKTSICKLDPETQSKYEKIKESLQKTQEHLAEPEELRRIINYMKAHGEIDNMKVFQFFLEWRLSEINEDINRITEIMKEVSERGSSLAKNGIKNHYARMNLGEVNTTSMEKQKILLEEVVENIKNHLKNIQGQETENQIADLKKALAS